MTLEEIEAIVAEIEREKEAGKLALSTEVTFSDSLIWQRRNASGPEWQQLRRGKRLWLLERKEHNVEHACTCISGFYPIINLLDYLVKS